MIRVLSLAAFLTITSPALAATLDGASMRWPWALPFAAMVASGPLPFPKLWHRHYGKIALLWSALALAALAAFYGTAPAIAAFVHTMLAEYLSSSCCCSRSMSLVVFS